MITLTVKRTDGSIYEVQYFTDAVSCDAYIAKSLFPKGFTTLRVDSVAADARIAQIQNAITNWPTLTAAQKDSVLKMIATHLTSQ